MNSTGYKAMLRDRVPYVVALALRWTKSKTRWVEHVYGTQVWLYASNHAKNDAVRRILGLKKGYVFVFHDTIDWENLSAEDQCYWNYVEGWVNWFAKYYSYMKNAYDVFKASKTDEEIKNDLKKNYLQSLDPVWQDKLVVFLMDDFKI